VARFVTGPDRERRLVRCDAMDELVSRLAGALAPDRGGALLVCTGAGISLPSGLDTFRGSDPDAIWKTSDVEMGTRAFFERDPVESWRWYIDRFEVVFDAEPNAAHEALTSIERWQVEGGGRFVLVTQNIDLLHERAGTRSLLKVHGTADRVRCERYGCENAAPAGSLPRPRERLAAFRESPGEATLPRCPACDALLRPHVLWFDETYDGHLDFDLPRVWEEKARMTLALFVGTSFSVGITEMLLREAWSRGVPVFSVDPGASEVTTPAGVELLRAPAEVLLPAVADRLGAG
jgi:NAD-dependent deacetylase